MLFPQEKMFSYKVAIPLKFLSKHFGKRYQLNEKVYNGDLCRQVWTTLRSALELFGFTLVRP